MYVELHARSAFSFLEAAALPEAASVGVEMRAEILFGDEASCLAKDGSARSCIQLRMGRDGERLGDSVRKNTAQLDVTAALGVNGETEAAENRDDLRA
jgi:hypothetical protein